MNPKRVYGSYTLENYSSIGYMTPILGLMSSRRGAAAHGNVPGVDPLNPKPQTSNPKP